MSKSNQRNLGRVAGVHGPSVVLQAKGRRAKCGKSPIVAIVSLGYNEGVSYEGAQFRHPELSLRTLDTDGETSICGLNVTMRFQSHVVHRGADTVGSRGFLATAKGPWVHSYGGELRARYTSQYSGKEITRMIALIDRAREAARIAGRCQLLQLVIGLQRCGVEVRVYSDVVDMKRAQRAVWEREAGDLTFRKLETRKLHFGGSL